MDICHWCLVPDDDVTSSLNILELDYKPIVHPVALDICYCPVLSPCNCQTWLPSPHSLSMIIKAQCPGSLRPWRMSNNLKGKNIFSDQTWVSAPCCMPRRWASSCFVSDSCTLRNLSSEFCHYSNEFKKSVFSSDLVRAATASLSSVIRAQLHRAPRMRSRKRARLSCK